MDFTDCIGVDRWSLEEGSRERIFCTYVRLETWYSARRTSYVGRVGRRTIPAATKGEPFRFASDLKQMVVVHELDLGHKYPSAKMYAGAQRQMPTSVCAGKSRAHLSGGVLQMAAVIG